MADLPVRSGPSGWTALCVLLAWFLLGYYCYPVPRRFRPPEDALYELTAWGVGFAVCVGVSIASLRKRPSPSWPVAVVATVGSFLGVTGIVVILVERLITRW